MSEKKSWDVARKPAPRPVAPVRQEAKRPQAVVKDIRPSPRVAPRSNDRLRDRRKKKQKVLVISTAIVLGLLLACGIYLVWRPAFRISSVTVEGAHATEVHTLTTQTLSGTYAYIVPRNSIYFFPTEALRAKILLEYPDISAVYITRASFGSIKITNLGRNSTFLWCGESILAASTENHCYNTDSEGLVFEDARNNIVTPVIDMGTTTSSSTPAQKTTPTELTLYSALEPNSNDPGNPVRSHVLHAERITPVLTFIKALGELGVSVSSLEILADEANIYTPTHTRITYVLGREETALTLAKAVIPKLTLNDGSIQYLDLRFSGKAYIKRVGQAATAP